MDQHSEIVKYLELKGRGSWRVGIEATEILNNINDMKSKSSKTKVSKTQTKKPTTLFVSFPLTDDWLKIDTQINKLAKKHNIHSTGSGAGFGMRDLDFKLDENSDLEGFKKAVKELKIKGLTFSE